MCRQGVFVENPHNFPQFPTLEGDLDPSHPQYKQIATQRRQIRKWKIRNRRVNFAKENQNQDVAQRNDENLSKKELRRIKNRESAAESRKRKIAEVEEAREAIEKLNQENTFLRQRLLELEQTVKTLKCNPDHSVHSQPCYIKPELTMFLQTQPEVAPFQQYYQQQQQQQQPFDVKKRQTEQNFNFPVSGAFNQALPDCSSDFDVQQSSFDAMDPFGLEFNSEELNDILGTSHYDFPNWQKKRILRHNCCQFVCMLQIEIAHQFLLISPPQKCYQ